jgi:phytanoyl-CoA hydroxylase
MKKISTCSPPADLWIDRPDAQQHIDRMLDAGAISSDEAGQLVFFRDNGYLILPGAVSSEQVESLRDELSQIWHEGEKYVVNLGKGIITHPDGPVLPRKSRLYDLYANNATSRAMVFAPALLRMLQLVFEEPPLVFQSMLFTWGSEQSIHKDTAFVVIDKPCTLAASWIALEDIEPGSGELMYYPGSHRDPLFLFDGEHLFWEPQRDGKGIHRRYSEFLEKQALDKQCALQTFSAKKGDALLWHANLAHGGTPITNPDKTRMSLVSHYCPVSNYPRYFNFFTEAHKCATGEAFYSSSRYDLRPGCNNPLPLRMR